MPIIEQTEKAQDALAVAIADRDAAREEWRKWEKLSGEQLTAYKEFRDQCLKPPQGFCEPCKTLWIERINRAIDCVQLMLDELDNVITEPTG